jgi:hypothetical protein
VGVANPFPELLYGKFRIFKGDGKSVMRILEQADIGRIGVVHKIFQSGG